MTTPQRLPFTEVTDWLPPGRQAAVVFSIDDVHPGTSADAYEAGGDLGGGALGLVEWLLERHAELQVTLFVAADWREIQPYPTRTLLAAIPGIRDRFYLTPILPAGTMQVDRHPRFASYLQGLPRTEIGFHGLHHVHRGPRIPMEFEGLDREGCQEILDRSREILSAAGLESVSGLQCPGWALPPGLAAAAVEAGLRYVSSARDVLASITPGVRANMSGLVDVPLLHPCLLEEGALVHVPSNFHSSCAIDRAHQIIETGGLLSIKAHIVKQIGSYVARDGMDELYRNYLDMVVADLKNRYGETLWWTTMGELAERVHAVAAQATDNAS